MVFQICQSQREHDAEPQQGEKTFYIRINNRYIMRGGVMHVDRASLDGAPQCSNEMVGLRNHRTIFRNAHAASAPCDDIIVFQAWLCTDRLMRVPPTTV